MSEAGRTALARIDAVLAARPRKDDEALAEAVKALCAWRGAMAAAGAASAPERDRLERLNGVVAVTMAVHFPIGRPPWEDLALARGWLADLLAERPGA